MSLGHTYTLTNKLFDVYLKAQIELYLTKKLNKLFDKTLKI